MKIIFFGTSEFACPSLKSLRESKYEVSLAVTRPDRKKGRHLHLNEPPVKSEAKKFDIAVHQPQNLSGPGSRELLKKQTPDLFVVVSFGQILKKELLEIPRFYAVNLHASLLPKYRGAAPVNWAIINGDGVSGVSIIKMTEKMDAGDIILSKETEIQPEDTAITLNEKLSRLGAELLLETIDLIEKDKVKFIKQDESQVSFAPKLKKDNGLINWEKPAVEIHNLVRGLLPWPGAFTRCKEKLLKIWKTEIDTRDLKYNPGHIAELSGKGIVIKTTEGNLVIKQLQLEGGKKMDASAFLRGHKMNIGDKFS